MFLLCYTLIYCNPFRVMLAKLYLYSICCLHFLQTFHNSYVLYHAMALDLPRWAIKAMDRIRHNFLWRGRKDAQGGHCLVAWGKVTRPKELGGLGISDLQRLNWALRVRWLWLEKTDPSKPWAHLPIQSSGMLKSILYAAMSSDVGDGCNTLFWRDRWLMGQRIEDLAPNIFALVPTRIANKRTVAEALEGMAWISDIRGTISWAVIFDLLILCEAVTEVHLQAGTTDKHFWRFSTSGQYSAKAAYELFFLGSTAFGPLKGFGKLGLLPNASSFCGWSCITDAGQQIVWQKGISLTLRSVLSVISKRKQSNTFSFLVFLQDNSGSRCCKRWGLPNLSPDLDATNLDSWWNSAAEKLPGDLQAGFNSIVILGAWSIWRPRNDCVFNGMSPSVTTAITLASDELRMWSLAGAKGLNLLSALVFVFDPG